MFVIDFEPIGRRGECPAGESLLDCARRLNVDIVSLCGGVAACHRCKVQIISGAVSPPSAEEKEALSEIEVERNYRLACRAFPQSDVKVHVPAESLTAPQRTQVEGLELEIKPDPAVLCFELELNAPSLSAPESDDQNLWRALSDCYGISPGTIDIAVQQTLSMQLRRSNWRLHVVVRDGEVIALRDSSTPCLGLAVDIGTTKIAAYLVDLETGRIVAAKGLMNPQISYGEDVVSRIAAAAKSSANAAQLQGLLVEAVSRLASELCPEIGADSTSIVDAVAVGNTAIHHLFLQLPVEQLGRSPYVPSVRSAVDVKARDLGLQLAPGAYVHLLPNIAGYVGADHVAMLLATGIAESRRVSLAIDIGTNTEICLSNRGAMASVSCASGPAFEGAHITWGMRAAPGAIEHVRWSDDRLEIQTIGGQPPAGICGSGLLDAIAELRAHGVIDAGGRMLDHPRVRRRDDGMREFVLAERPGADAIVVSQKDVRELQLAKAAIRLGVRALVEAAGLDEDSIDEIVIAGAFGTFIDVASAVSIGMLPDIPMDRFRQVGNAAGTGARLALMSRVHRERAQRVALLDGYIELAGIRDFNRKFAEASALRRSATTGSERQPSAASSGTP